MNTNPFYIVINGSLADVKANIGPSEINIIGPSGESLLLEAIAFKRTEIAMWLIEKGCNLNHQDSNGQTALHYCAAWKNSEIAEAIILAGGNVDIRDKHNNSALWTAVSNSKGKYEIVRLYMKNNPDTNTKNNYGRSPLDLATQINDPILIDCLMMKKGDQ